MRSFISFPLPQLTVPTQYVEMYHFNRSYPSYPFSERAPTPKPMARRESTETEEDDNDPMAAFVDEQDKIDEKARKQLDVGVQSPRKEVVAGRRASGDSNHGMSSEKCFCVFNICTNLIIKYIESTGQSKAPGTVSNVSQSRRGSKQSSTENAMDPEKDGRTSKSGSLENSTDKRPGTVSRINSLSFFTSIRFLSGSLIAMQRQNSFSTTRKFFQDNGVVIEPKEYEEDKDREAERADTSGEDKIALWMPKTTSKDGSPAGSVARSRSSSVASAVTPNKR